MAGEVTAADGAIDRGARIVAESRQSLTQQLAALQGKLAGIGAQWKGSGSTAFQQLMARWNEDSAKIISALNGFEENLKASQTTYTTTDDTQQSSFASLQSRLG